MGSHPQIHWKTITLHQASAGCSHIILMRDILRACDLITNPHTCSFQLGHELLKSELEALLEE
jgi:hypothetical protein